MSRSPAVILFDSAGLPLAVENGVAIPASTKGVLSHARDVGGIARSILAENDGKLSQIAYGRDGGAVDRVLLTEIDGKLASAIYGRDAGGVDRMAQSQTDGKLVVATTLPESPPGTTPFTFAVNEAELEVGAGGDVTSPHESLGAIVPSGDTVTIQFFTAGSAGDPSEAGSVIELYWREGGGPTDHLIERLFVGGQTVTVQLPSANQSRDGTALVGNGTNTRLMVRRKRESTAAQPLDFVVRGYTEAP
jgi:hypothetical protein